MTLSLYRVQFGKLDCINVDELAYYYVGYTLAGAIKSAEAKLDDLSEGVVIKEISLIADDDKMLRIML